MPASIIGLLVAAGAALVVQNLLMARMTETVSTVVITLVTNSAVGLLTLLTLLICRNGLAGIAEAIGGFRLWSVLPGLLGSFFVFASIAGYQRLGAASTIAILVASQLTFGLAIDMARSSTSNLPGNALAIMGGGLLIIGAFLVASRRF